MGCRERDFAGDATRRGDRMRWSRLPLMQTALAGAGALLGLAPPAQGEILILPLRPARAETSLSWAVSSGALAMGNGALPGSYVVVGSRAALLGPALRNGALLLDARATGCFASKDPNNA